MPSMTFSRGDFEPGQRTLESAMHGVLRWCGIRPRPHLLVVGDSGLMAGDDGFSENGRLVSLNPLLQVENRTQVSQGTGNPSAWTEQLAQARRRRYDAVVVLLADPPCADDGRALDRLAGQLQAARARAPMVIVVPPAFPAGPSEAAHPDALQHLCQRNGAQCVSWLCDDTDAAVLLGPGAFVDTGGGAASRGSEQLPTGPSSPATACGGETARPAVRTGSVATQLLQQTRLSQILFS